MFKETITINITFEIRDLNNNRKGEIQFDEKMTRKYNESNELEKDSIRKELCAGASFKFKEQCFIILNL